MKYFLGFVLVCLSLAVTAGEHIFDYKYWDLGASQKRDEYQFMLLRLVLEKTQNEFGSYQLTKSVERYASLRSVRELEKGELINIIALPTPIWGADDEKSKASIVIPKPLLHGLLGYRCLVVKKTSLQKFAGIKTQDQLREMKAGQGRDWEDINVYKYNRYSVVDSADFYNLFAMLDAGRFDYLPLSIIEADEMLVRFNKHADNFVIVPDLLIYYPFPVLFNVSIKRPDLVGRIEKGLELVEKDGSMEMLFQKYFATSLQLLNKQTMRVAVLKTPYLGKKAKIGAHENLSEPILMMVGETKPVLLH